MAQKIVKSRLTEEMQKDIEKGKLEVAKKFFKDGTYSRTSSYWNRNINRRN